MFLFWMFACEGDTVELPVRAYTELASGVVMGPCACPEAPLSVRAEVWRYDKDKDKDTLVTPVLLDEQCRVLSVGSPSRPTGFTLGTGKRGAVGLDNPPSTVECPDHAGVLHFKQGGASCPNTFHNAQGVGPDTFTLIPSYFQPRSVQVADGETRPLNCEADRRYEPYAPDWRLTGEAVELVDGTRQVTLTWEPAPTLKVQVLDTAGEPLARYILNDPFGARVLTDDDGRAAWGRSRGPISLSGTGPMPAMTLHLQDGEEHVIESLAHPAITVHYADLERLPQCALGLRGVCLDHHIQSAGVCRCEADDEGQVPLIWSGGLVTVPAGVDRISLDTSEFTAEVYGELEGRMPFQLKLEAVGAPKSSIGPDDRADYSKEHGFVFHKVAPGRYNVTTTGFSSKVLTEIEVTDGPMDLGTLVIE